MEPMILRVRRAVLGLTQRELSVRTGIAQTRVSLIERGSVAALPWERRELSRALALPPDLAQLVVEAVSG